MHNLRAAQPQAYLRPRRGRRPLRRLRGQAPGACTPPPGIGRPRSHSALTRQGSRSLPPPAPFSPRLARKAGNVEREQRTPRPTAIRDAVPPHPRPRQERRFPRPPSGRSSPPHAALTQAPEQERVVPPAPLPRPRRSPRLPAPARHRRRDLATMAAAGRAAPAPRPPRAAAAAAGGLSPRDPDTAPRLAPSRRPAAPSLRSDPGRALFLRHRPWDQRVLPGSSLKRWKNSSLELRRGAGGSGREQAQRKAPRGRGGGNRSSGRTRGQSTEAARTGGAPTGVRGDSLPRWHSRAEAAGGETAPGTSERPTSTRVPETLPPPPPARASPPRTSPRAPSPPPPPPPTPPGASGSNLSANQRRAPGRCGSPPRPPLAPPRPALLLRPLWFLPAQLN
ncbi:LOW QUALITY PROTEIN: formin-like protein 3 [Rousettus aegyptiacus]|uniref:LOW QUALITY PROTEIN: formin-like protein 3 n=1 Tax=Rousettus aegyptiacus TaxID=9407 RepID=UPI00168D3FDD|nr:LOW QUALITY PROTEIN: formin-like protein 3 [Rousettus aegyptiacus]